MLTAGCLGSGGDSEYELDVIDRRTDEEVADYHGHWHGELPSIPLEDNVSLGAVVEDENGEEVDFQLRHDDHVEWETSEAIDAAVLE
ncbi:hypothetical protein RBH26_00060 [Natronolimnohabitans sp. A-GB9]|uniref:hypothetical protein n=1 Tax=Natronolimnohabitans sp. A-GB9 TaxID=3069757 RepID=UPI0027B6E23F|nr:hypothetical protein [Natronolimnohabitans sp. A-GB9]MDQ2048871.1 hypothetical protein [Natronolimnohabitans sp. A-GB9]